MIAKVSQTLTLEELAELKRLEEVVTSSFDSISQHISVVGEALSKIRECRFYRVTHTSFESYCRERWGKSARAAYKAIGAWETKKEILDSAPPVHTDQGAVVVGFAENASARSLVEIAKIKQEKRIETILAASKKADGQPITPRAVKTERARLDHRPIPSSSRPNGFESCYGSPAPTVCAPAINESGPGSGPAITAPVGPARPAASAPEGPARQPSSEPSLHGATGSGLTLDQFRAKVAALRVTRTALIVFVDDGGQTKISRMNFRPDTDQLEIE